MALHDIVNMTQLKQLQFIFPATKRERVPSGYLLILNKYRRAAFLPVFFARIKIYSRSTNLMNIKCKYVHLEQNCQHLSRESRRLNENVARDWLD